MAQNRQHNHICIAMLAYVSFFPPACLSACFCSLTPYSQTLIEEEEARAGRLAPLMKRRHGHCLPAYPLSPLTFPPPGKQRKSSIILCLYSINLIFLAHASLSQAFFKSEKYLALCGGWENNLSYSWHFCHTWRGMTLPACDPPASLFQLKPAASRETLAAS